MVKTFILVLFLTLTVCTTSARCETVRATQLDCKSLIAGALSLTVTKTGCRIKTAKTLVIMKAPDWKVCVCNPISKLYCITTAEKYVGMGRVRQIYGESMQGLGWKATGQEAILGIPCRKYTYIHGGTDTQHFVPELRGYTDYVRVRRGEYWIAPGFSTPEVEKVFAKATALPTLNGFPMRLRYVDEFQRDRLDFQVLKISKTSVSPSDFDLPSTFRQVKSETEVVNDPDTMDGIDGLMKNINTNSY